MRRHTLTVLFLTVLFFLAACTNGGNQDTVRVAEVTRSVFYAPFYAAIAEGYFEEEGIDIDLTTTWGGDKTMTALLSDGADAALVGAETSIYVHAQEASDPAINFAALTQTDGTFLVSRETTEDFVWEDLKDSVFLGQRAGGMPQMVGEYVLNQHDIDPHSDLELIQSIDFGNIASAFASGTGDYVQLFEPQATMFEQEGLGTVVASFGEASGQVPYTTFMAKQSMLDEDRDLYIRFAKALHKGQELVNEQDPSVTAAAIVDYFEDTPEEVIAEAVERYRDQGSYAETPELNEEAWNHLQDIMDAAGELPNEIPFEELVDERIATESLN
ncbi:ABC transporter substrate-binding protein [Shouchella shacheensis]|uniref:ABC transporter substrate-binding protein n=1 Tax=Shouchella shacheensis TaxID=1649580 RepID=UPI0007405050|nr:ABC transporter substrate-binding protein [Shouchella shacheensis]